MKITEGFSKTHSYKMAAINKLFATCFCIRNKFVISEWEEYFWKLSSWNWSILFIAFIRYDMVFITQVKANRLNYKLRSRVDVIIIYEWYGGVVLCCFGDQTFVSRRLPGREDSLGVVLGVLIWEVWVSNWDYQYSTYWPVLKTGMIVFALSRVIWKAYMFPDSGLRCKARYTSWRRISRNDTLVIS